MLQICHIARVNLAVLLLYFKSEMKPFNLLKRENLVHWKCSLYEEHIEGPLKVKSVKVCMSNVNIVDACSKIQYYDNSAKISNS